MTLVGATGPLYELLYQGAFVLPLQFMNFHWTFDISTDPVTSSLPTAKPPRTPHRSPPSQIQSALAELGAEVESVKIVRDRKTGESKGFAFAKFFSIEHARQFVDTYYPFIQVAGARVRVDYSRNSYPPDGNRFAQGPAPIGVGAFPAVVSSGPGNPGAQPGVNDGQQDVGQMAHTTLLVRGLDTMTTEEMLHGAFKAVNPPPLQVRLIRDRMTHLSWGFAFVEFKDMPSAAMALSQVGPPERKFTVDGKTVQSSWAHEGSFTPVYGYSTWAVSSRKDTQGNPVWVQYWDEGAYASAFPVSPEEPKEAQQSTGKEGKKKKKKAGSPKMDSVDAAMNAFYATVGPDINASVNDKDAKFFPAVGDSSDLVATQNTANGTTEDGDGASKSSEKKTVITIQGKKQQVQIQKWTAISQEAKVEEEEQEPTVTHVPTEEEVNESQIDASINACLLCQRGFDSMEKLKRHQTLSELHKTHMKAYIQKFADKAAQDTQSVTRWRNRAAERRRAFGQAARIEPVRPLAPTITEEPTKYGIPSSNVGSKLLEKQGWKPGQGLGRDSQGIVAPIQATAYGSGVGLGATMSNNRMRFDEL
ncbi:hypothetical protein M427DRAFT_196737 [Gonapodya prolifera JEL478]|uniref:RNA-binding domain-containing protein n=1 Tax=Gonapodya prolifera (strain JEL478) TaxID=1344416 RepID=A0A139APS3_GONPJ|nr:hypothetical protein M427DRAFT_196737 [Gonapodya prolifera JEL478]|eukprot:KXS18654.1 hypothetical protein M427DRAFT_196737 [Gonapodya prolifera JEL478]